MSYNALKRTFMSLTYIYTIVLIIFYLYDVESYAALGY